MLLLLLYAAVLPLTLVDASRLFYLPLPKLRPSFRHDQVPLNNVPSSPPPPPPPPPVQEKQLPIKSTEFDMQHEGNSDEDKNVEPSPPLETEKRDSFDWDALVDQNAGLPSQFYQPDDEPLRESLNQWNQNEAYKNVYRVSRKPVVNTPRMQALKEISANHHTDEPWPVDNATARYEKLQSSAVVEKKKRRSDAAFLGIVAACSLIGIIGLVGAAIFWYKIQKQAEAAAESEYPSYGVTGPQAKISPSSTMSDRKLAQSAQMYHYQQQRHAMMQQENRTHMDAKPVQSDESDDEATGPGGGDYTVYECPGLAPTGEMEVRNPLFAETDPSLALSPASMSHPSTNNHYPQPTSSSPPKDKSSLP